MCISMTDKMDLASEEERLAKMNEIVGQWKEDARIVRVRPRDVIPDTTNRAKTGLSVDHVHFIATKMLEEGFNRHHELPVVVRECASSELGSESLNKFSRAVAKQPHFPPVRVEENFFCSLGNGHFFQALNLFDTGAKQMFDNGRYSINSDPLLADSLENGVPCIVLNSNVPLVERRFVSEVLNTAFDNGEWVLRPDGTVFMRKVYKETDPDSFEALSKFVDSFELSELVNLHMKAKGTKARL